MIEPGGHQHVPRARSWKLFEALLTLHVVEHQQPIRARGEITQQRRRGVGLVRPLLHQVELGSQARILRSYGLGVRSHRPEHIPVAVPVPVAILDRRLRLAHAPKTGDRLGHGHRAPVGQARRQILEHGLAAREVLVSGRHVPERRRLAELAEEAISEILVFGEARNQFLFVPARCDLERKRRLPRLLFKPFVVLPREAIRHREQKDLGRRRRSVLDHLPKRLLRCRWAQGFDALALRDPQPTIRTEAQDVVTALRSCETPAFEVTMPVFLQ